MTVEEDLAELKDQVKRMLVAITRSEADVKVEASKILAEMG